VDYLSAIGMPAIAAHEQQITAYALDQLRNTDGVRILGPDHAVDRWGSGVLQLRYIHPHDVPRSSMREDRGPRGTTAAGRIHQRFGVSSSTRQSFYLYTTFAEIDALVEVSPTFAVLRGDV